MNKNFQTASFLLTAAALVGCGGDGGNGDSGAGSAGAAKSAGTASRPAPATDADRLMVEYLDGFEEMTASLRKVKDEDSAKAAGRAIKEIGERLSKRGSASEGLSDAELTAASMRYAMQFSLAQTEFGQALMPVMTNQAYAPYIQAGLEALPDPPVGND